MIEVNYNNSRASNSTIQETYQLAPIKARIHLGLAWAANSVNCVSFRSNALITADKRQFGAFYRADGHINVFVRFEDRTIEYGEIKVERLPKDAHQSISMAIDSEGFLHLAYGAHGSHLTYARSKNPLSVSAFFVEEWRGADQKARSTYPMFLMGPDKKLKLLYREGFAEAGDIRVRRWDLANKIWIEDEQPLVRGRSSEQDNWAGPYFNRLVVSPTGEVFAFVVWRLLPKLIRNGLVNNVGVDLVVFSPDLDEAKNGGGFTLNKPVSINNSERIIAVPHGRQLINQAGAGLLPNGLPCAVTYWAEESDIPQFRLIYKQNRTWCQVLVSDFSTRFCLEGAGTLPLPHSRPDVLIARDGRALVIFRSSELNGALAAHILSPPLYDFAESTRVLLLDENLGFYEPVIDYSAWEQRGVLSMYVQRCVQERGDDDDPLGYVADSYIMEWSEEELLGLRPKKRLSKMFAKLAPCWKWVSTNRLNRSYTLHKESGI